MPYLSAPRSERVFPSPELVTAAAAALPAARWTNGGRGEGIRVIRDLDNGSATDVELLGGWVGPETLRWHVHVSPGVVALEVVDPARAERRAAADRSLVTERPREDGTWPERTPTREVTVWSRKSRSRMVRRLAEIDYTPLFEQGRPGMVTLTYPGEWEALAPNGATVKGHWRSFLKRWHRRWGFRPAHVWKLEFQGRGAPHLHALMPCPDDPTAGPLACSAVRDRIKCRDHFRCWLSATWADIVGAGGEQRRRHVLAGTGVDFREGDRMTDPKRVAVYFAKHGGAGGGKEYQHTLPESWRTPGNGPGHWWGYGVLRPVVATVAISPADGVLLKRTLRRWSKSQGLKRRVVTKRSADRQTGEIRKVRRAARPLARFDDWRLCGGFVQVNNAPAMVWQLARLLDSVHDCYHGAALGPGRGARNGAGGSGRLCGPSGDRVRSGTARDAAAR